MTRPAEEMIVGDVLALQGRRITKLQCAVDELTNRIACIENSEEDDLVKD